MTSSFPLTRWSIIAAAGKTGGEQAAARTALGEICRLYWFPLYCFARRRGLSAEDAEDATQTFFLTIFESNLIASADPALGRLRTFLLKAFSDKLIDLQRAAGREKRGGSIKFIPLDLSEAEGRYEAGHALEFEAAWASALIEGAVGKLQADYTASDRGDLFTALLPYLGTSAGDPPDQAALAAQLGMSHAALRQSLARFRERFRSALRVAIGDTLRDPTDTAIDEELRALRAVLAGQA
jgi:DNA-directed RNA polymerase specialized sigma24 family protein